MDNRTHVRYTFGMGVGRYNWAEIQRFVDEGNGFKACRNRFGIAYATWAKAIARGDLMVATRSGSGGDGRRIYDWSEVQRYYDDGHTVRDAQRRFGFSSGAWEGARKRGEIVARRAIMSLDELLKSGISRYNVKMRLLRAGLLKNECQRCGLTHWNGRPLSLHLDHINGSKGDHRLENLRMLCPNCHSQTETYGGKNMKRRRRLQGGGPVV
ncbi:MAG TPA: HNH endonuclease signature motif containing protein [Candidatus Baltobacteraceae bacterium]|nr:HNH endonuclease signature motif containing protein [Candidatus Baltobacteraceae bacterium]